MQSYEPPTSLYVRLLSMRMVAQVPWAEAMAISSGRVAAVGSYEDVMKVRNGPDTIIIDMQGHFITPVCTRTLCLLSLGCVLQCPCSLACGHTLRSSVGRVKVLLTRCCADRGLSMHTCILSRAAFP